MTFDAHRIAKISPGWWGAAAGVATAGAVLVPGHRILAGVVGGLALLALAYTQTPCCAGCAAAAPSSPATVDAAPAPVNPGTLLADAATANAGTSCGGGPFTLLQGGLS